ncbi:type II CRISPR RNA-guided endonuclease Cas9 [Algihabitans albus]|uniref:type II CRISPR RNA-guided endonuclease Cas9 n=1 Tax=Algihabitans albus TaxID=2164067 RepID=UPI0013C31E0A|nr:type II CRISPR RNA-guided endonuclease Cas9 [Algihabitans albus]
MKYRLGLDLGSNSIGWCLLKLEPRCVLDAGVRILTPNEEAGRDPQSKTSLAAERRDARSARRRRDRFLRRQKRLLQVLTAAGLMPADTAARKALETLDPYWLRAEALDRKLTLHEIGRAVFHLNQRRGFKSNRIADGDDAEKSATKQGMKALRERLEAEGARSLGELLARRHRRDRQGHRLRDGGGWAVPEPVRFRPTSQGSKNLYDLYPAREMVAEELEKIWAAQAPHHPELTGGLLESLRRIVIDQRPLRTPPVGRCSLRPEVQMVERAGLTLDQGERAPKAHPLFQRVRILQEVANLRVGWAGARDRALTLTERDAIVAKLMASGGTLVAFDKLRAAAKLPEESRFNHELSGRKGFQPDQTAVKLAMKKAFGKPWRSLERDRQIEVVERLLGIEDPEDLIAWLQEICNLDPDAAEAVSELRLPQGHGQLGRSILADLVAVMESQSKEAVDPETGELYRRPLTYDEAVEALNLHHSNLRVDGTVARLPYYGAALARHVVSKPDAPDGSQERIGRVPNPTVHIALNQLRKIVNALIEIHGPPEEIVIELGRELKLSRQRKEEIERDNRANERKNAERRERLAKLGVADSHDARLRLRLFDELPPDERVCVFTGTPLNVERLFDGSVEVEHLLPFSQTLDDSFMNKALCTRAANRQKGNRPPAEAWSGEVLREIVERAERILQRKAWRFQPDAMARFDADGGFLARQLIDTQYMSRLAKTYLEQVCERVWAPPGRLTAMLRAKWGLNDLLPDHNFTNPNQPKNRKDHRHHAIDAFVVACTDRGLLNRMARASGRAESLDLDRLFPDGGFPEPFPGFRADLSAALERIVVSHKPDHGLPPGAQDNVQVTSGQLHEATAYGEVKEEIDGKPYNLVTRKPVLQLTDGDIGRIRDARLREDLQARMAAAAGGGKLTDAERRAVLEAFANDHGLRRLRILKTEASVRRVEHRGADGQVFTKAYTPGGNHRVEIFTLPDGSWGGEGVTVHDANQPGYRPHWREEYPGARLFMRLHNGDLLEADFEGKHEIYRVYRLEPSAKRVRLAGHKEAGSIDQRHNDPDDPLRWIFATYERLRDAGARPVRVDVLGRVSTLLEPVG